MGGDRRLAAMIGARNFVAREDGIQFKWGARAKNGANAISIDLTPDDTYTVTFWKGRGANTKKVETFDTVYADQLKRLFETVTGLYLSL